MLSLYLLLAARGNLAAIRPQDVTANNGLILVDPSTKEETGRITIFGDKLNPPKLSPKAFGSPKQQWSFDWRTAVYGAEGKQEPIRFVIFSQEQNSGNNRAPKVARMLERLWEYNFKALKLDHSTIFGEGRIDVYLCWGGKAGGEQLFDSDDDSYGHGQKVNTIYLYDLNSFTSPVEMAREVAHEYGHASLPPIGGYREPEDWANGYLGEKLFLRHIETEMAAERLSPADAMGATLPQLKVWVASNVDPLVARAAVNGPNPADLKDRSKAGMDAYVGLALYIDTVFPEGVFSRSMQLVGSTEAVDYPDAIVLAAEEPARYTLRIPSYLAGKAIWIPLAHGKLSGATVSRRNGDWALIRPGPGPVTVTPQH